MQTPQAPQTPQSAASGPPLTLTAKALEMVRTALQREGRAGHALRVGISGGGCSGMKYNLAFEEHPRSDDAIVEIDGVRLLIDPASEPYLQGVVIDYVTGLHGAGFKFLNPKAQRTCGCGSSFSS